MISCSHGDTYEEGRHLVYNRRSPLRRVLLKLAVIVGALRDVRIPEVEIIGLIYMAVLTRCWLEVQKLKSPGAGGGQYIFCSRGHSCPDPPQVSQSSGLCEGQRYTSPFVGGTSLICRNSLWGSLVGGHWGTVQALGA